MNDEEMRAMRASLMLAANAAVNYDDWTLYYLWNDIYSLDRDCCIESDSPVTINEEEFSVEQIDEKVISIMKALEEKLTLCEKNFNGYMII